MNNPEFSDPFVKACILFQQARVTLSQHLGGGVDANACDQVSRSVYDLANKAVRREMRDAKKERPKGRVSMKDFILKSMHGRKTFSTAHIEEAARREGRPLGETFKVYVSHILASETTLFQRVKRGVYKFKTKKAPKAKKKSPKQLPASTS